jgi:hypothetical protein
MSKGQTSFTNTFPETALWKSTAKRNEREIGA